MTTDLVFVFEGQSVRSAGTLETPLFCAADVCAVLTIENVGNALSRLDADEQEHVRVPDAQGKNRATVFVTESGLFSLILGSNKPSARAFKKWVTSEVLPAIRKKGYYSFAESQAAKTTELLLANIFPKLPGPAEPIFRQLIAALIRLRGEDVANTNPVWARQLASMIYEWALPVTGQQAHRREKNATPNGSSVDYSMLSEEALMQVRRVADHGVTLASAAVDYAAWKALMSNAFGRQRVLHAYKPFLYALPPKSEAGNK